jgi:DNA-binding MarR family transcriptional regulator
VVLWIAWIWGEAETRMIAEESGVSKATLSGVLNTLEKRGLAKRKRSEEDGRLVLVTLTPAGTRLIKRLFPEINSQEQVATSLLDPGQQELAADFLRQLVLATGHPDG